MFKEYLNFFSLIFIRFSGSLFSFLFFIIVSNSLTEQDYGIFAYYYSLASLIAFISLFGFELVIIRKISIYFQENKKKKISGLIKSSVIIGSFITLISYSLFFVLEIKYYDNLIFALLFLISLFLLIKILITSALNAIKKNVLSQILDVSFILIIFLISVIFFYLNLNDVNSFVNAVLISSFATFLLALYLGKTNLELNFLDPIFFEKSWIKSTIPIYLRDILNLLFDKGLVILLAFFYSPVQIAYFFTSQRVGSLIDVFNDTLLIKVRSRIPLLINQKKFKTLKTKILYLIFFSFIAAFFLALAILFLSKYIISAFNLDYNEAAKIFFVVITLQALSSCLSFLPETLILLGKEKFILKLSIFTNSIAFLFLYLSSSTYDIVSVIILLFSVKIISRCFMLIYLSKNFISIHFKDIKKFVINEIEKILVFFNLYWIVLPKISKKKFIFKSKKMYLEIFNKLKINKCDTMLHIGCNAGHFLYDSYLKKRARVCIGIDINKNLFLYKKNLKQNFKFYEKNIVTDNINFKNKIDIILCHTILCYLNFKDLRIFLKKIKRIKYKHLIICEYLTNYNQYYDDKRQIFVHSFDNIKSVIGKNLKYKFLDHHLINNPKKLRTILIES